MSFAERVYFGDDRVFIAQDDPSELELQEQREQEAQERLEQREQNELEEERTFTINDTEIYSPLDPAFQDIGSVFTLLLPVIFSIAAIILFFILIWGGYDFMLSQGEQDKISSARSKITAGIIGFILLVISFFLVQVLSFIFGLDTGIL